MSDNPFDVMIAEFDRAVKASRPMTVNPGDMMAAQLQHEEERRQAEEAAQRKLQEAIQLFAIAVAEAVAQRGCQRKWNRQDFVDAKALVEYLTSVVPTDLKVQPRQAVNDSTRSIFYAMVENADLPEGTFQGERSRTPKKRTGRNAASGTYSSQRLSDSLPPSLRRPAPAEPKQESTNVVQMSGRKMPPAKRPQRRRAQRPASSAVS